MLCTEEKSSTDQDSHSSGYQYLAELACHSRLRSGHQLSCVARVRSSYSAYAGPDRVTEPMHEFDRVTEPTHGSDRVKQPVPCLCRNVASR